MQPNIDIANSQTDATKSTVPNRWVKPVILLVSLLMIVGLILWAFLTLYWNTNDQIMLRILNRATKQTTAITNSTVSMKYKGLDVSADIDFATDGLSAQLGFDGEVRYGSNRYDTAATLVGDNDGYMLKLRNPRQFLYDLSGVYATATQTDGMYDDLSSKIDNKWLELDDITVKNLVGTDKLTKAVSCIASTSSFIRSSQPYQREFAESFRAHPFLSISSGRNDTVSGIPARTYALSISQVELSGFVDSYDSSEAYGQAKQCYGSDLKRDLEGLARILEEDFSFSLSVSRSSQKILKIAGSVDSKPYSLVFETVLSQENMGTITKPKSQVKLEDIDLYLQPIIVWLDSQRVVETKNQVIEPLKKLDATTQP